MKAVVDVRLNVMFVDAEMHSDLEAELLAGGSQEQDLWGINIYPTLPEEEWIEFDSMINLRPSSGNLTRGIDDPGTREKVAALVRRLVLR